MPSTMSSPASSRSNPRLFVAIPVVMEGYSEIRERFGPFLEGRWTDTEQLHLTLAFLDRRFDAVTAMRCLDRIALRFEPVTLSRLGYFPRNRIFHALAVHPSLHALAADAASAFDLPRADIVPHVTLMRVKALHDADRFRALIENFATHPLGALLPECRLYESTLHRDGTRHTVLKSWPRIF